MRLKNKKLVSDLTQLNEICLKYKNDGKKVIMGAADTFRAAAIDQLDLWAKKINIPIIKQEIAAATIVAT